MEYNGIMNIDSCPIHVLVVDDDTRLQNLLKRYLSEQGFKVSTAGNTETMNRLLQREAISLIVLDIMMPGENGLDCCKRLRGSNDFTPVIMLTARGDDADRILGLELGADDYLAKPFNPRELVARIQAVLRRVEKIPATILPDKQLVDIGPLQLDLHRRLLKGREGIVPISSGQYELLEALVSNAGKAMSRSRLLSMLNDREYNGTDRGIDIQISRLRKIIEPDPANPRYLRTVWGRGYMYVPDANDRSDNKNEDDL